MVMNPVVESKKNRQKKASKRKSGSGLLKKNPGTKKQLAALNLFLTPNLDLNCEKEGYFPD